MMTLKMIPRCQLSRIASPILLGCLMFALSLVSALAADQDIYVSDFANSTTEWVGRPGGDKVPPKLEIDSVTRDGKAVAVCNVTTDGGNGCGFSLKPEIACEPGVEYILSFWLKVSGPSQVTYRIVGKENEFGENSKQWFKAPKLPEEWVQVERYFNASTPALGLDIAMDGAHEPTKLAISDVKISKVSK